MPLPVFFMGLAGFGKDFLLIRFRKKITLARGAVIFGGMIPEEKGL